MTLIRRFVRAMTVNHAQLHDSDDDPRLHRWRSVHPPAEVIRHLISWVRTRRQWDFAGDVPDTDATGTTLIHHSAILRFTDDVHIRWTVDESGTVIDASSRSRIGKGDLGQNRRNLIDLRNGIPDLRS